MSYLVLARKWRPQTFEELIGQPHVTKTLQNAIRLKRIAHAYLFTGARGVGKTSVARILAKAINCERDISPFPCNECSNCREITQGNSVDVLEIDGASNRGIDNIRELRETVRYRPGKSRYKIYIIDEVHMLTTEAFNALLKTLEEPPDHVLFIFATTEPHKIPSTILSRCQRFDFRRIPMHQLLKHLADIVREEKLKLSDAVLYAVAREADGSMRDAQSLLEQLLAFSGDGLGDEEILDILGVVDRRSVHRAGEAILAGDVRTCLQVVEDLYRRGIDSRRFCQQLCDHFRNLLFLSLGEAGGGEGFQRSLPEEEQKLLRETVGKTTPDSLYLYFQMILKGEEEIRRSTLPRIALEMLLLRLAQLPRLESLNEVLDKLTVLESRLASEPMDAPPFPTAPVRAPERPPAARAVTPEPIPEPPMELSFEEPPPLPPRPFSDVPYPLSEAAPPVSSTPAAPTAPEEVAGRWTAFLQWLQGKDGILAAKLGHSRITSASDSMLELEILEIYESSVNEAHTLAKLTGAAREFFGQEFRWSIKSRSSMQPRAEHGTADATRHKHSKVNPKRLVMEHPVFQQAIEILGGELLDIRHLKTDQANRGEGEVSGKTDDGTGLQ